MDGRTLRYAPQMPSIANAVWRYSGCLAEGLRTLNSMNSAFSILQCLSDSPIRPSATHVAILDQGHNNEADQPDDKTVNDHSQQVKWLVIKNIDIPACI